jgi:Mn2+/Fe2+ NRAMP family transporter
VKGFLKAGLGVVTSIAGFIEVGSLSTSAQAGAAFRFQLLWAIALATICLIFLIEMSGRLAAVSKHTLAAAVRERFGIRFQSVPLTAEIVLDTLVLTAEIGGACVALHLLSGLDARWWALPVGAAVWLLLWRGRFSTLENGISMLGLVALSFVIGVYLMHPDWGEVARGFAPSRPDHDEAHYGFLAVSILGATISPYLLNFYSAGAVEDDWGEKDIVTNRIVSVFGMGFGSVVSMGVLAMAALVLAPRGVRVEQYEQAALVLTQPFGKWGLPLFAASLFVGCFGAALEVALNLSYVLSQALGWNWGEDQRPEDDARFCTVYTAAVAIGAVLIAVGVPPLKLTMLSMALTVLVLPLVVFPFLVILNDPHYLRTHRNGRLSNLVVLAILAMGALLALVVIPLEVAGGR